MEYFQRADSPFATAKVSEERLFWESILKTAEQEGRSEDWVKQAFRRRPIYSKGALILIRKSSPRAADIQRLLESRDYTNILFF